MALSRQEAITVFSDAAAVLKMIETGQEWLIGIQKIWEDVEKL